MNARAKLWSPVMVLILIMALVGCIGLAVASYLVIGYATPWLDAGQHTDELCTVLQIRNSILNHASATGDTTRLEEAFPPEEAQADREKIRQEFEGDIVHHFETEIISCKVVYYTMNRAETETIERTRVWTTNRQSGEIISPNPAYPELLKEWREAAGKRVFFKQAGLWTEIDYKEYWWRNVKIE